MAAAKNASARGDKFDSRDSSENAPFDGKDFFLSQKIVSIN
jgi:hypothetical protein